MNGCDHWAEHWNVSSLHSSTGLPLICSSYDVPHVPFHLTTFSSGYPQISLPGRNYSLQWILGSFCEHIYSLSPRFIKHFYCILFPFGNTTTDCKLAAGNIWHTYSHQAKHYVGIMWTYQKSTEQIFSEDKC